MKLTDNIPGNLSTDWVHEEKVQQPSRDKVGPHYHEVDEWLRVRTGSITFTEVGTGRKSTATDKDAASRCLFIPAGEVHAVEAGDGGVEYEMWTRRVALVTFKRMQPPPAHGLEERRTADLIRLNFAIPEWENEAARRKAVPPELLDVLHERLLFRRADGRVYTFEENQRLWVSPNNKPNRVGSSDLGVRFHQDEAVASITVYTADPGATPRAFQNIRHFVFEERWKLRFWVNFPV